MSKPQTRAFILVPVIVVTLLATFFILSYLVTIVVRIPFSFGFPLPIRVLGLLVLAAGALFYAWLFRYRPPRQILVSTYVTFSKLGTRTPLEALSGRTEPLIIEGPYRFVRHPIYFDVVLLIFGWWLLLDYSSLLVAAVMLFAWFHFVVAPFEEKELRAIFREQYEQYAKQVPRLIPFTKRRPR